MKWKYFALEQRKFPCTTGAQYTVRSKHVTKCFKHVCPGIVTQCFVSSFEFYRRFDFNSAEMLFAQFLLFLHVAKWSMLVDSLLGWDCRAYTVTVLFRSVAIKRDAHICHLYVCLWRFLDGFVIMLQNLSQICVFSRWVSDPFGCQ